MSELIERDNVIAYLNAQIEKVRQGWLHDYGFPTNVIASLTDVKNLVKNLPTISAEPIRHGRWIMLDAYGAHHTHRRKCSECGEIKAQELTNLCQNCGARMDGGADNA